MTTREHRKAQITQTRKNQILDAALSVFTRKGFGEATVADIAAEAGIGVGTIYNYYKDKHDLLISLIAQSLISPNLTELLSSIPSHDDQQFMEALLKDRLEFGFNNAQKLLFLFFEIQRSSKLRRQYVSQVVNPLINKVEEYLLINVRNRKFRHVDVSIIARALAGVIIGTMILYRLELKDSPYKKSRTSEIAKELSHLFLYGLLNK